MYACCDHVVPERVNTYAAPELKIELSFASPLIPVAYEQIYDAFYNKVRGQNPSTYFGIYDVVRWDNVWMAQS